QVVESLAKRDWQIATMSANLAKYLSASASRDPSRPALICENTILSYETMNHAAARFAGWLRARGVSPGDRVGLMFPNGAAFAIIYQGILRAGAVVVPMNILFKRREVAYHVNDAAAPPPPPPPPPPL